ncbi:MAG: hypothetical protein WCF57_15780 [Pyrinomonadaceae bacterium]
MAGKQAISENAGRALFADQSTGVVYRALRPIRCASCDQVIAEGDLFTRHSVFDQGMPILPKCQQCIPFTLAPEDEKTRHPMLDALLSPPAGKSSGTESTASKRSSSASDAQNQPEQERIAREVRRRLGPALARSKRRRAERGET